MHTTVNCKSFILEGALYLLMQSVSYQSNRICFNDAEIRYRPIDDSRFMRIFHYRPEVCV